MKNRENSAFTPSLLWNRFRENAPKSNLGIVKVEGIFKGFNSDREYAGRRYGTLTDANDGKTTLSLRIPKALVPLFTGKEGDLFTIIGTPYWDMKPEFGRAEIVFDVKEVEGVEVFKNHLDEKAKVINEKAQKGWKDVEKLLRKTLEEGRKPKIGAVIGETAIVDRDVLKALGDALSFYLIEFKRVSLVDEKFLAKTLLLMDRENYDLIALVRGGGSGLEVFDSTELAKAVLSMKTPFVTALGHAQDVHLLDKVADRYFITPTEFGRFLHEVANSIEEVSRLRNKVEELEMQVEVLARENFRLEKELARKEGEKTGSGVYLLVILILLGLLLLLMLFGGR